MEYPLLFVDKPSSISTKENPIARASYEEMMLTDPSTGKVPLNVRSKELAFSRLIPSKVSWEGQSNFRTQASTFDLAGPSNVGGRTRGVAIDIRNEATIIAGGVSGGIWKSTDGGSNWRRTSDPTIRNSVSCLSQDRRAGKEDNWYFGTGELVGNSARASLAPYRGAGIYHSSDNGESWQVLPSTLEDKTPDRFNSAFQYIWNLEVSTKNTSQDEILVAAFGGVLRSIDGGVTWETTLGTDLLGLEDNEDINLINASFYTSLKQTKSGNFFAALSSASSISDETASPAGFYFSVDGINWQDITPFGLPAYQERTVIGVNQDENEVYFLTQGEVDAYLWKYNVSSLTGGELKGTWQNLTQNIPAFGGSLGDFDSQTGYNMVMEVHPENDDLVFIGGTNLYRSTDGFSSSNNTKWIGGYDPKNDNSIYTGHYADQHALLFMPSDPSSVISATDGGIRVSSTITADSVRWTSRNSGYLSSQFYTIAQRHDEATSEILGGLQDNGSYFRDGLGSNPAWNRLLGGDGAYCAITPNRDFLYVSFQKAQIYRLTLNSNYSLSSFARVDPSGAAGDDRENYLFINPYVLDPNNPNRMFLLGGNVIWRNENLAQIPTGSQSSTPVNWDIVEDSRVGAANYTTLEICRSEDILLAGVFHSLPAIVKVHNASDALIDSVSVITSSVFPENSYINSISANPENADHFVVVFSNYGVRSVFETTDGGETFVDVSFNLEETEDGTGYGPSVRWVEVVPLTGGITYFVGTSTGLYSLERTFNDTDQWVKEGEDLIGSAVITMLDYRDIDGRLVVASHGNGTFQSFLEGARPFENQPTVSDELILTQNYPNPFTDRTVIDYSLPQDGLARIDIFDDKGRLVRNLLLGRQFKGDNRVFWDGTNSTGTKLRAGVYFCVLTFDRKQSTKRIIYKP
ncbi:MAG: T9SS type A sorting domain-containing protein [Cyclobacteriaceae bacterium]